MSDLLPPAAARRCPAGPGRRLCRGRLGFSGRSRGEDGAGAGGAARAGGATGRLRSDDSAPRV